MRCFPLWVEMFSIMGVRSPSCSWPRCGLVSSTLRCCQSRQSVPPGSVLPCRCLSGRAGLCPGCARVPPHAPLMGPVQNTCCSLPSCWCCLTLCCSPRCAPGSFRAVSSYTLNLQPCKSSRRGSAGISGGAQHGDRGASALTSPLCSASGCGCFAHPSICSWFIRFASLQRQL